MRNLLTHAITSVALATLLGGTGGGADGGKARMDSGNLATQNELERDASQSALHRGPLGVVIARGDATDTASRVEQSASADGSKAWLYRSPAGQVIGPSATTQAADLNAARDDD